MKSLAGLGRKNGGLVLLVTADSGDPRRSDMKDILNLKIKRRESFRPFAPSVLQEETADWFELTSPLDADVPYMMQVYPIRIDKRSLIPAVTHVDGSGRLQTVNEADNGRYYRLIHRFFERTGVPMVLNTSFNENEPIVCTPRQALNVFCVQKWMYLLWIMLLFVARLKFSILIVVPTLIPIPSALSSHFSSKAALALLACTFH